LNAVYDATGVRIDELPVTPERLIAAMQANREKSEPRS
jgi:CO/xanthine dehydrogenase Mo-binding subunit